MSSTYHLICVSHDPALMITEYEWNNAAQAVEALAGDGKGWPALPGHDDCDLLVGRFSSPLIEVGCPPLRPGCTGVHNRTSWVDVDWLRLLLVAYKSTDLAPTLIEHVDPFTRRCWTSKRLERLRSHL